MNGQPSTQQPTTGSDDVVSRRRIVKNTVGAVALGAIGGAILTEITSSPASAAQATSIEPGGLTPVVVNLTDASSIAIDASLGNDFRVTIAGNRTMGTPANPTNGGQIIVQVTQGAGAPHRITWSTGYQFSAGLPQPTLSTVAGQTDLLGFVYNATTGTWLLAAFLNGFS